MGEWIAASCQIGGKITKRQAEEIISGLNHYDLKVDFDGASPTLENLHEKFGSWSVNYGNLDELTNPLRMQGIDYRSWFDSGPEWSPGGEVYIGGVFKEYVEAEGMGVPVCTLAELERDGFAATVNRLKWLEQELPKLEIIDG